MAENDTHKTAVCLFVYTPIGLKCGMDFVYFYIGATLIMSQSTVEHEEHLRAVL